jgi:hypothetical protein
MSNFVSNNGVFDANQFEPVQGGSKHPIGMFPFTIKNTQIISQKDNNGGMFRVTFESPAGEIDRNYNLWNQSQQAVEIAHKQLSALCHVTGIFKIDMKNQGRELVGARGSMEVGFQKGQEPTAENPAGGYVEVKKVFDVAGNEPGKSGGGQQQPQGGGFNQQPSQQPPMQNTGGGWGQPQQNAAPQNNQPAWGQQPPVNTPNTPLPNNNPPWGQQR